MTASEERSGKNSLYFHSPVLWQFRGNNLKSFTCFVGTLVATLQFGGGLEEEPSSKH